jgi:8-amino-7-oxononanoate synthase
MTTPLDRRLRAQFAEQEHAGLNRVPPAISERHGIFYKLHERPVVGFCSNDYLGLADHPALSTSPSTPTGATASRLVCGDLPEHRSLESRLARLAGTEDAVLFPSGFQLNVGALPALIQPHDHVSSDTLNHASLIDGLRLARATPHILPHGHAPEPRPTTSDVSLDWWVTEALFSMDGDYADPRALREHLARGGCLYLDEAHSFGLFTHDGHATGHAGRHQLQPTALIGTLGKAFGCAGAFIAASSLGCRWIRGCARSFVFSTGVSPMLAAQIHRAVDLVDGPEGTARRDRLWTNVEHLAHRLGCPTHRSPIFRIVLGSNEQALTLSAALVDRGWHAQAIRPPTVPRGTSRLRITVTAAHESAQIDAFADDLRDLLERHR